MSKQDWRPYPAFLWTDPRLQQLQSGLRRVFDYIWTGPGVSGCGVSVIEEGVWSARIGDSSLSITKSVEILAADGHVVVDLTTLEVWPVRWFSFQRFRGPAGRQILVSALTEIRSRRVRAAVEKAVEANGFDEILNNQSINSPTTTTTPTSTSTSPPTTSTCVGGGLREEEIAEHINAAVWGEQQAGRQIGPNFAGWKRAELEVRGATQRDIDLLSAYRRHIQRSVEHQEETRRRDESTREVRSVTFDTIRSRLAGLSDVDREALASHLDAIPGRLKLAAAIRRKAPIADPNEQKDIEDWFAERGQ